jgi:hypothetical protein
MLPNYFHPVLTLAHHAGTTHQHLGPLSSLLASAGVPSGFRPVIVAVIGVCVTVIGVWLLNRIMRLLKLAPKRESGTN